MGVLCDVCGLAFYSMYNLKRHKHLKHSDNIESNTPSLEEDDKSTIVSDESEVETDNKRTESGGDSNSESSDEDYDETYFPEDVKTGNKNPFWVTILSAALKSMSTLPTNIEALMSSQYFPDLVDSIRDRYCYQKRLIHALDMSQIEEKMSKYEDQLIERNFSNADAKDLTWDHLKYLFKRLIERNEDIVQEELIRRGEEN